MSNPLFTDLSALSAGLKALAAKVGALALKMDARSAGIDALAAPPAPDQRSAVEMLDGINHALDRLLRAIEGVTLPTPRFADLDRVRVLRDMTTDEGVAVPTGTRGTVVPVYPGGASYEVEFAAGLATVGAADLAAPESAASASPSDAWVPGGDWTPNAETLAALTNAEAGRTTPITLDQLRAEILADDDDTDGDAR